MASTVASFPKESVSATFAALLMALNGHSFQDEVLVRGHQWRVSKQVADQEGENADDINCINALTDFLSSMHVVFGKILKDHPDFDTKCGVLESRNNIVCCRGAI